MIWPILLAIWLILWGLLSVSNFNFDASKTIMGIFAIVIGGCIFFERFRGPPSQGAA